MDENRRYTPGDFLWKTRQERRAGSDLGFQGIRGQTLRNPL
jgi:hypothetical protein